VSVSGKVAAVDGQGCVILIEPGTGEVAAANRRAKASGGAATSGDNAIFVDSGHTSVPILVRYSFETGEVLASVPLPMNNAFELLTLDDSVAVWGENDLILLENDDLSERWDFPFEGRRLTDLHYDSTQILMVLDEKTIAVLGRNSGVVLWEIQAEEFGYTRFAGALIDEGRILAWGENATGDSVLKILE